MFPRAVNCTLGMIVALTSSGLVYLYSSGLMERSRLSSKRPYHGSEAASFALNSQLRSHVKMSGWAGQYRTPPGVKLASTAGLSLVANLVRPQPLETFQNSPSINKDEKRKKARKSKKTRQSKGKTIVVRAAQPSELLRLLDFEEMESHSVSEAIDLTGPLDSILNESPDTGSTQYHKMPRLTSLSLPVASDSIPDLEQVDSTFVPTVAENKFLDIQETILEDKAELKKLGEYPVPPETDPIRKQIAVRKNTKVSDAPTNVLVAKNTSENKAPAKPTLPVAAAKLESTQPRPVIDPTPTQTFVRKALREPAPLPTSETDSMLEKLLNDTEAGESTALRVASVSNVLVSPTAVQQPQKTRPKLEKPSSAEAHPNPKPNTKPSKAAPQKVPRSLRDLSAKGVGANDQTRPAPFEPANEQRPLEGYLYGRLTWDDWVEAYLEKNQGHVELELRELSPTAKPIPWYYDDPSKLTFDASGLVGKFQLRAKIFIGEQAAPVSLPVYRERIDVKNFRDHIRFHITRRDFHAHRANSHHKKGMVQFWLTVFEGGAGSYRNPDAIANARVEAVGLPMSLVRSSDEKGNIDFGWLTANSQYLFKVSAPGYYDNYVVLPTGQLDSYESVFLVKKQHVGNITQYFTKRPQRANRSVLIGRLYNPITRAPQAEREAHLSSRRGHAVYYQYLSGFPDPKLKETTKSGLFGFFNVLPGFRVVKPEEGYPRVINVRDNTAQYLEFGRTGAADLEGRIIDPYLNNDIHGDVRILGQKYGTPLEEENAFSFSGLQQPTGVLTLELQADGYFRTWFDIPWLTEHARQKHDLYVVSQELIEERAHQTDTILEQNRGTLVGGASPTLFKGIRSCLNVSLYNVTTGTAIKQSGAVPLVGESESEILCLRSGNSGFIYYNLEPGEYVLNWHTLRKLIKSRFLRVRKDGVTMVIN